MVTGNYLFCHLIYLLNGVLCSLFSLQVLPVHIKLAAFSVYVALLFMSISMINFYWGPYGIQAVAVLDKLVQKMCSAHNGLC